MGKYERDYVDEFGMPRQGTRGLNGIGDQEKQPSLAAKQTKPRQPPPKEKYGPSDRKFSLLGDGKPFPLSSQGAIDLLEGIMPAEKAQAVPYVSIWEINPETGAPKHPRGSDYSIPNRPLTMMCVEQPKFGSTVQKDKKDGEVRFRERPPVSLERVSVKTNNPRGIILYRTVEIVFVVHQPDIIFEDHVNEDGSHKSTPGDSWSSIVTPGETFAMEYGWSASAGVKNGILNGLGFNNSAGINIPGRERIRFVVTNYTFSILPDNQTRFVISAFELGEFNLRQAFLVPDKSGEPHQRVSKNEVEPYKNDSKALKILLKKVKDEVAEPGKITKNKKSEKMVYFGRLFDVIFADVIKDAYTQVGFNMAVPNGIVIGNFNDRAGTPAGKYGSDDVSGLPISDFAFPLSDIERIFSEMIKAGTRLTLYNFIEPFLRLFERPEMWDRKNETRPEKKTIPQITMRSITTTNPNNPGNKQDVTMYIFDVNREYTKFSDDDYKKGNENLKRSEIKKAVNDKGVPFVSFVRANSYIKDANFEVIQDDQMKGIFIRRYFGNKDKNRSISVDKPDLASKENSAPPAQQIFAPTIKGKITMLGNFVIGTFALVWLDFGIRRWDGPFTAFEREDTIERGNFTTTMSVYSSGTDPLGTQGKPRPADAEPEVDPNHLNGPKRKITQKERDAKAKKLKSLDDMLHPERRSAQEKDMYSGVPDSIKW